MASSSSTAYRLSNILLPSANNSNNNVGNLFFSLTTSKATPFFHYSSKSLPFKKPSSFPPQLSSPCLRITRVSTAPVEYAPSSPEPSDFRQEISRLQSLRSKIAASGTLEEKDSVINADSRVRRVFFKSRGDGLGELLGGLGLDLKELFLLKCLVAADRKSVV